MQVTTKGCGTSTTRPQCHCPVPLSLSLDLLPICSLLLREGRNSRKPAAQRKAQQHSAAQRPAVFKRTRHLSLPVCPAPSLPPSLSSRINFAAPAPIRHFSWVPCELQVPLSPSHLACLFVSGSVGAVLLFQCETCLSSTSLIALESEVVGDGEEEEGIGGYMAPTEEAGEDERLLKDLPGSSDKEGEDQENIKSNPDETNKEDCDNGGSIIEVTVSSEDLNDRHGSDSNSQCAESNGACKPVPEMSSKSINGECASEVPEMGSKSSNDDNSGSTDEMPRIGTKSSSDDSSECAGRSSPRAVLDMSVSGSVDSDDSASVEQPAESSHNLQWRNLISGLILRRKKSMGRAVTFPQRSKSRGLRGYLERMRSGKNQMDCSAIAPEILPEIGKWRPSWRSFDYEELCAATDRFSPEKLIGKGGHAEVYKGQLADGQFVAVKRLTKGGNKEDRVSDFLSELGIIAHVNHPNAAQLLGFSVEGGLHLVLQFSPHGSLASVLHGTKETLKWKVRFNIALGIAEGLLYLHEGCHRRIIHRDIKASNILLTEDYQPQISDFGLAKWLPDKLTHHVVYPIEGTFGYMAPEYFMHGIINEKTDVFAYGVLLLELVTGRKAVDSSRQSLVIWAKPLLDANNIKELVDPSLGNEYDPEEMVYTLAVASLCIHHSSTTRPSMKSVVCFLKGDRKSLELVRRPKIVKPLMFDSCDSEDYTRSSYLNDLNRHKQLALEQ